MSRLNVIKEILETERFYVRNLKALETVYSQPLEEYLNKPGWLTAYEHSNLFGSFSTIVNLNEKLLADLELNYEQDRKGKKVDLTIGEIFLKFAPFLKTYTTYTNSFNGVSEMLRDLRKKNKLLNEWLTNQSRLEECNKNPIESLLIMPVQRIPRYNLLINELLKHTSQYHRDYATLQEALVQLKEVATYVNERIREFEDRQLLNAIAQGMEWEEGKLVAPHRRVKLILCAEKGGLKSIKSMRFNKDLPPFILFLSDLVLICSGNYIGQNSKFDIEKVEWENMKIDTWFWLCIPKSQRPEETDTPTTDIDITDGTEIDDTATSATDSAVDTYSEASLSPLNSPSDSKSAVKSDGYSKSKIPRRYFFPWMFDLENDEVYKHAFQIITEYDIYTLSFESDNAKWDCMNGFWKILSSLVKADPTVTKCYAAIKDYEDDALEVAIIQQRKERKKYKTFISTTDLPKFSSRKKEEEMNTLVNADKIERIKNLEENTCIGVCVATATFQLADPTKFQINFYRGDLFMIFEKVKKGKKWWIVRKCGINNSLERKLQLTSSKLPSTYTELRQLQIEQQRRAKKLIPRPAQLKPITHHMVKVNKITDDEMKEITERLDMEKLLQGEPSSTETPLPSLQTPHMSGRRSFFMKSTSTLLGLTSQEEIAFFKSIINVYNEKNETGIAPCDYLKELTREMATKVLRLVERRDEMEIRKVRNFMIKKKNGDRGSITPNTSKSGTPDALVRSNTVTGPPPSNEGVTPSIATRSNSLFAKKK